MIVEFSHNLYYHSQHINDLSLHIELPWTVSKAEGIYYQLISVADQIPDDVRVIIGLEPLKKTTATNESDDEASGNSTRVNEASSNSRRNSSSSANVKLGENEVSFERGMNLSYI